jgi:hypothetical protein
MMLSTIFTSFAIPSIDIDLTRLPPTQAAINEYGCDRKRRTALFDKRKNNLFVCLFSSMLTCAALLMVIAVGASVVPIWAALFLSMSSLAILSVLIDDLRDDYASVLAYESELVSPKEMDSWSELCRIVRVVAAYQEKLMKIQRLPIKAELFAAQRLAYGPDSRNTRL